MDIFYFGNPEKDLFGAYHPPAAGRMRQQGIVLCHAIGQEYIRSHRAFRFLADRLAGEGFHVLRFDYYATGDSDGDTHKLPESDGAALARWEKDIVAAIRELRDYSGVENISLVGLRLGATLAAQACQSAGFNIPRLVLWEPVIDGAAYFPQLTEMHADWVADLPKQPPQDYFQNRVDEILGFPYYNEMVTDLPKIAIPSFSNNGPSEILLIGEKENAALTNLEKQFQSANLNVSAQWLEAAAIWRKRSDMDSVLIPNKVLNTIVEWFKKIPA